MEGETVLSGTTVDDDVESPSVIDVAVADNANQEIFLYDEGILATDFKDKATFAGFCHPVGSRFYWLLGEVEVTAIEADDSGDPVYTVKSAEFSQYGIAARVPQRFIDNGGALPLRSRLFHSGPPAVLSVDNFYRDPMKIREIALAQPYVSNIKAYKGKRTGTKFLFPGVKEEFERLLGVKIADWLTMSVNGVFQITKHTDPLVYHSDVQSYAAAVYLTPDAPPGMGTSFWRSRKFGCRRPPFHPAERNKFPDDETRKAASDEMYSEHNLLHEDGWELIDKFGGLFNRLVIWDSQLVHSASSYEWFPGDSQNEADNCRLVQLYFFNIQN